MPSDTQKLGMESEDGPGTWAFKDQMTDKSLEDAARLCEQQTCAQCKECHDCTKQNLNKEFLKKICEEKCSQSSCHLCQRCSAVVANKAVSFIKEVPVPDSTPGQVHQLHFRIARVHDWVNKKGTRSQCMALFKLQLGQCDGCCCRDAKGTKRLGFATTAGSLIDLNGFPMRAHKCKAAPRDCTLSGECNAVNCIEDSCETWFLVVDGIINSLFKFAQVMQLSVGQGGGVDAAGVPNQMEKCSRCIDADPKVWGSLQCKAPDAAAAGADSAADSAAASGEAASAAAAPGPAISGPSDSASAAAAYRAAAGSEAPGSASGAAAAASSASGTDCGAVSGDVCPKQRQAAFVAGYHAGVRSEEAHSAEGNGEPIFRDGDGPVVS